MAEKNYFERVYQEKTIQYAYKFKVYIENFIPSNGLQEQLPMVEPFLVRSVTIPSYKFRLENVDYNNINKSFALFENTPLTLRIEFDEDAGGTIARLVRYLQRRIMKKNGIYNPPNQTKIKRIRVDILSNQGEVTSRYVFFDCLFQDAEDATYDYSVSDNIKTAINFSVDYMTTEPLPNYVG